MRHAFFAALLVGLVGSMLGACNSTTGSEPTEGPEPVGSWAIQLSGVHDSAAIERLARADVDLLIVDPVSNVKGREGFPMAAVVAQFHARPGRDRSRKLCLAYLNVGQAESYRDYWTDSWRGPDEGRAEPDFMLSVDPDGWEGNYPVAYWDPRWRGMLFGSPTSVLDRVLADGFDGVFLDWVLAFSDKDVVAASRAAGVDPVQAMADLLRDLSNYGRAHNPAFRIVANNAAGLVIQRPSVGAYVDAVIVEPYLFGGAAGVAWDAPESADRPFPQTQTASDDTLARVRAAGSDIWTLTYATDPAHVDAATRRSLDHGYVPFVTRASLDRLPTHLPLQLR